MCLCLNITYQIGVSPIVTIDVPATGTLNGYNTYQFVDGITTFSIWHDAFDQWNVTTGGIGVGPIVTFLKENTDECPIGSMPTWGASPIFTMFTTAEGDCSCVKLEDRIFKEYGAIKLPVVFNEQDRGYVRCCCDFMVLASGSSDTWKNDKNSAWIKLSDPTDTVEAVLYKNGVPTNYVPVAVPFINEPNAFYWTISWFDVLVSDGEGCYTLKISYNISGIIQEFTWGVYTMKEYSIYNALQTARVRVMLNSHQEIEDINFSGSNVEDSLRFYGFIGNRQPNTEIDNLIYQSREVKKVVRENLNSYEILTDPTCDDLIRKLTDLLLLSENELFISDYNKHNHSYRYLDLPAIVENAPELTYYPTSRQASLKCVVGDKFKNKRSYY
jgi:hypothetical protein